MDAWDYELNLDKLTYQPQTNHWFEIRQYEGARGIEIHEGVIENDDNEGLKAFLKRDEEYEDKKAAEGFIGGLKLLYSYIDSDVAEPPRKPVFWRRNDFEEIIERWCLPKRYSQMLRSEHIMFSTFHPDDAAGRFAYIFSTFFHHNPFWSLAASYDEISRTTYALLHCDSAASENSVERLKYYLTKMAAETKLLHPLLLPIIIADLETNLTLRDCEEWKGELDHLEQVTEKHVLCEQISSSSPADGEKMDPVTLMQKLNACSVFIRIIERECDGVLEQLPRIQYAIGEVGCWWGHARFANAETKVERKLRAHVEFLLSSRRLTRIRLDEIQKGTKTQLDVLYHLTTEREEKWSTVIHPEVL